MNRTMVSLQCRGRWLLSLVLVLLASQSKADGLFDKFDSYLFQNAGKIVTDPPGFLYEFQRNMEQTSPLPPGRRLMVNYHFLSGFLIVPLPDIATSAINGSAKLRLHPEGRRIPGFPQVDFCLGYWASLLTGLVEKEPEEPDDTTITDLSVDGSYYALTLSSSIEPKVRLFWGYKYSRLNIELQLSKEEEIMGQVADYFNNGLREHTVSAGIELATNVNKQWVLQWDYGIVNKVVSAKVMWQHKIYDFGINFYPEAVFFLQPQMNFHVFF
jgi:hypothetical protein